MSRKDKVFVSILVGLFVACLCIIGAVYSLMMGYFPSINAWLLESLGETDPQRVLSEAAAMIDFELPPGYYGTYALTVGEGSGLTMVVFENEAGTHKLTVTNITKSEWHESDKTYFQEQAEWNSLPEGYEWSLIGQQTRKIRSQDINVFTYEGKDKSGGITIEKYTDPFDGKAGLVMISLIGRAADWPEATFVQFLDSIK
jgi:hypothetical protein